MSLLRRHSEEYNFIGSRKKGLTFRWGKSFSDNPPFAPWPEFLDISISNHCSNNCSYCYRDSGRNYSFMSVDDFEFILSELNSEIWGNVFQVAIGGGEPFEHPFLYDIINLCDAYGVIPNVTTKGRLITVDSVKQLVGKIGAIALSISNIESVSPRQKSICVNLGLKVSLHYLLSKTNLNEAIKILEGKYNHILKGFNAIVFLTYKPAGRAQKTYCLGHSKSLIRFLNLVEMPACNIPIGFDACIVPLILHMTKVPVEFLDCCEGTRFSAFIDENLNVSPCSFSNIAAHSFSLKEKSFSDIWNNDFKRIRESQTNRCVRKCAAKSTCVGSCPYFPEVSLCHSVAETGEL